MQHVCGKAPQVYLALAMIMEEVLAINRNVYVMFDLKCADILHTKKKFKKCNFKLGAHGGKWVLNVTTHD